MQRHLGKQNHTVYTIQTVLMNFLKNCKEITELYLASMKIMSTAWETEAYGKREMICGRMSLTYQRY